MLDAETYLALSAVLGLLQLGDALLLAQNPARAQSAGMLLVSIFEYAWAVVSYQMLSSRDEALPHWLPALYLAYMATGTLAGLWHALRVRQQHSEHQEHPEQAQEAALHIPKDILLLAGLFGAAFALSSLYYLQA